jgi:hypothetical protein
MERIVGTFFQTIHAAASGNQIPAQESTAPCEKIRFENGLNLPDQGGAVIRAAFGNWPGPATGILQAISS